MLIRTLIYTLRLITWVRFFLGLNVEVRDIVAFFVPMSIVVHSGYNVIKFYELN